MPKDGEIQTVSAYEAALNALSVQQAEFVREYLLDFNGKQAAIRAGYSEKGADVRGSKLLAMAKVRSAVDLGS